MGESSFQKKKKRVVEIPGTKLSVHNSQLLSSSGISSLDNLIGGGLPVGSVILIQEDYYGRYAQVIINSFVAEGLACGHYAHIVSPNAAQFVSSLPAEHVVPSSLPAAPSVGDSEQMKIAWRYQQQKDTDHIAASSHKFNYSKKMREEEIPPDLVSLHSVSMHSAAASVDSVITNIADKITSRGVLAGTHAKANLLRIAISPNNGDLLDNFTTRLPLLKALVRNSFSIAMITMPADTSRKAQRELIDTADFVMKLSANQDRSQDVNPLYKEFDGVLEVKKISAINSLVKPPHITQLGFKLLKTRFKLQKLHLPPDLSETVSRSSSKPMCNLEF